MSSKRVFPQPVGILKDDVGQTVYSYLPFGGLTKRELFAVLSLQALMANDTGITMGKENMFETSVACADALIAELAKETAE